MTSYPSETVQSARRFIEVDLGFYQTAPLQIGTVVDSLRKVYEYENEESKSLALSVIPVDRLDREAEELASMSSLLEEEQDQKLTKRRALLECLVAWFKQDFFTWVDAPQCDYCMGATSLVEVVEPSNEDAQRYKCSRTEMYMCQVCRNMTSFPRYNDPAKLIETRKGRCGEFSNCFGLCCRAMQFRVRIVNDFKDHVWNEVEVDGIWLHVDPCEGMIDKPLLYEQGWGKSVELCIGVDVNSVVDVTRRYCKTHCDSNDVVIICCDVFTRYLRERIDDHKTIAELEKADALEKLSLMTVHDKKTGESLPGRTTGSKAWVEQRGEAGNTKTFESKGHTWTRYRPAKMLKKLPHRLDGGVSRASGENEPLETSEKAFDGMNATKWLDFGGVVESFLEYRILPADEAVPLKKYSITSANDAPERDPKDFSVEILIGDEWRTVDERKGVLFSERGETKEFYLSAAAVQPSKRFRLHILSVRVPSAANSVQLARWDLFTE